jgi:hypothetical protein
MPKPRQNEAPETPAKFIQIAVSQIEEGDSIYALDEDGVVWCFNGQDDCWEPLSETRAEEEGA